ncbi:MAG: PEP-CTERM sorting domain-containing protein, partial [Burkholderiaceae bacterium]|nr:PEP-CTERM sorting domain-containing protein [Burkholderiaceae bacterium]
YFNIVWGGGSAEPTALYNSNATLTGVSMAPLALAGTMHIRTTVVPGVPLAVGAILELEAHPTRQQWATVNFGHTGRIAFELPDGYSFTSRSGRFLTSAVPEPATALLMLLGIGALGLGQRRPLRRVATPPDSLLPCR